LIIQKKEELYLKIASVIVNNPSKNVDKEFDYLIPSDFADILRIGMRVTVPFGFGNKTIEGYVTNIVEGNNYEKSGIKYKYIQDIADSNGDILIDAEGFKLASFIKEKYHSTMSEAIRLILPSGTTLQEHIYIKLLDGDLLEEKSKYKNLVHVLEQNKYIELRQLNKLLGKDVKRAVLLELAHIGVIEVKREMAQNINIKIQTFFRVSTSEECKSFMLNPASRSKRQAEILNLLSNINEQLTQVEICETCNCSPAIIKTLVEKGYLIKDTQEQFRNPFDKEYKYDKFALTADQMNALASINAAYKLGKNKNLIHGVTGCGKTEIYLSLIQKHIDEGNGAIMLVPEISLTPQTVERFKGRFGNIVAVIHSRLSEGEKYDEWRRIKSGEAQVAIGARSAVFAPVKNLKVIIIDEEHEYSYKSEITPKYLTSEIAEFRVDYNNGLLVLGSATPSVESYYKAKKGSYNLVEIENRIDNKRMPTVSIVDMREELRSGNKSMFSRELFELIGENIKSKQQTILFLNRRGYSTFVSCRQCGYICKCDHCDVSLTYHMNSNKLSCHYCGTESMPPQLCPKCGSKYIKHFGTGTEKIEGEIRKLFPNARVLRMDMDTTRKKGSHEKIYNEFKDNNADILIGTQMISKGMDFNNVTLVGVISADTSLNIPDFRAGERTFQLLTQVAGRSGRGSIEGKVVIQTYEPDNFSIKCAKTHDYKSFYNDEINNRQNLGNPPFSDLIHVVISCENEAELIRSGMLLKEKYAILNKRNDLQLLGPTPCHISKIKNNYRWHMVFKGNVKDYYDEIFDIISSELQGSKVGFSIDINPYSTL
jgi:primosomal protein N' (replication factor Y) (superfamily II helicase)